MQLFSSAFVVHAPLDFYYNSFEIHNVYKRNVLKVIFDEGCICFFNHSTSSGNVIVKNINRVNFQMFEVGEF